MQNLRPWCLGLAALLLPYLGSCGSSAENQQKVGKEKEASQDLSLNLGTEPPTLDPQKMTDSSSRIVLNSTFEGLMNLSEEGKAIPGAAVSYEISEDLKTYTFYLRKDNKWSNGDPLTAHDFEYAWKRVMDPMFDGPYAYQLYVIRNGKEVKEGGMNMAEFGVKALDAYTLQVQLENPTPYFLALTAWPTFYPVNEKIVSKNPEWANEAGPLYTSNGPFFMESWEHQDAIQLRKSPSYWNKDEVRLNGIFFTMVEDAKTALNMFNSCELDWVGSPMGSLPPDALPSLQKEGKVEQIAVAGSYWYVFNTKKPPFDNKKIRKALALAINRKAIVENVTQGGQVPAHGVVPISMALQDQPLFEDNDVETALRLFEEALLEMNMTRDELPSITLSYNTDEGHQRIAQEIQQQWKRALGIQVNLENMEWKVYLDVLQQGEFQIARMGWIADFNDPIAFLEMFQYEESGNNRARWENPRFVELVDQSATTMDVEKRRAILREAETVLINDMPVAPIYFYTYNFMKKPYVKKVALNGLGDVDFKHAYLKAEG